MILRTGVRPAMMYALEMAVMTERQLVKVADMRMLIVFLRVTRLGTRTSDCHWKWKGLDTNSDSQGRDGTAM